MIEAMGVLCYVQRTCALMGKNHRHQQHHEFTRLPLTSSNIINNININSSLDCP